MLFNDENEILSTADFEEFNEFQENNTNEDLEVDNNGTERPLES